MRQRQFLAAAVLAGVLAAGTAAHARKDSTVDLTPPAITMTQAVATAEQQANGRAVEAELEHGRQGVYYEVKVAGADGIHKVYVDATDGKVLGSHQKNPLTSWLDDDDDDDDDD
jgi:uncharacterized membrane protein YkoI